MGRKGREHRQRVMSGLESLKREGKVENEPMVQCSKCKVFTPDRIKDLHKCRY